MTLVWGAVLIGFGLVSWGPLLEAASLSLRFPSAAFSASSFSARSMEATATAQPSACSRASPSILLFGDHTPLHLRGMSSSFYCYISLSAA